jgi:uncharacterized protein YjgD (DUF1641 family)
MMSQVPRGTPQLEQYLEYLENRGVLDQVLDDCKGYVQHIKEELAKMETTNLLSQPALLNPE